MGHAETHKMLHGLFNDRQFQGVPEHLAPGFMFEDLGQGVTMKTAEEFTGYLQAWADGFSDATIGSASYLAGGDFSVCTFHARGHNDGPMAGMPATGKAIDVPFCEVMHFGSDGKVLNAELYYNQMALLTQLGVMG